MRKLRVPTLVDINLHISFSEAIVEAKLLREYKPSGWEENLLKIKHRQSEIWLGIRSGEIEVSCWSDEYSIEDRIIELKKLQKEVAEDQLDGIMSSIDDLIEDDYEQY